MHVKATASGHWFFSETCRIRNGSFAWFPEAAVKIQKLSEEAIASIGAGQAAL